MKHGSARNFSRSLLFNRPIKPALAGGACVGEAERAVGGRIGRERGPIGQSQIGAELDRVIDAGRAGEEQRELGSHQCAGRGQHWGGGAGGEERAKNFAADAR